jgi:hypothetical protein
MCGAVGGKSSRGNRSTRKKPALVPFCAPQIPHDLTWLRIQTAAVGSRRLTAWAAARSVTKILESDNCPTYTRLVKGLWAETSIYWKINRDVVNRVTCSEVVRRLWKHQFKRANWSVSRHTNYGLFGVVIHVFNRGRGDWGNVWKLRLKLFKNNWIKILEW